MNPQERTALLNAAATLENMAENLRYVDNADIPEDAANAIVSHARSQVAIYMEHLSEEWGFDSMAVCFPVK